jgi:hypothetical protein
LARQQAKTRLTTARQHVLDYLAKNEVPAAPNNQAETVGVTAAMITAACGASQAVINGMETAGLLKVKLVSADQPPPLPRHDLDHVTLTLGSTASRRSFARLGWPWFSDLPS